MQAISQLHTQLSEATTALEFVNLKVAQLQEENAQLLKTKEDKWQEIATLDEQLENLDDDEQDAQSVLEKEQRVADLEARLDLLQHQVELVPLSFNKLANAFCEQSKATTKAIESMVTEAINEDFWSNCIVATVAEIDILKSRQTNMAKRLQLARQGEEQKFKEEAAEEENSLKMIESLLAGYEQKLQALPDPPRPPTAPRMQTGTGLMPATAAAAVPAAVSTHRGYRPTPPPAPKRTYEEHHPHPHPHNTCAQPTVHTHTVTIEEVVTLPAGAYPPTNHTYPPCNPPSTYPPSTYPPSTYPPTNNAQYHRHRYHEPPHHEPSHQDGPGVGQQPYNEASHEDRPWFQVLKRRRSVETSSSSMDLETAYESSSSSSCSSSSSSSSSSSAAALTPASTMSSLAPTKPPQPRFRSGLDLLLESEH